MIMIIIIIIIIIATIIIFFFLKKNDDSLEHLSYYIKKQNFIYNFAKKKGYPVQLYKYYLQLISIKIKPPNSD